MLKTWVVNMDWNPRRLSLVVLGCTALVGFFLLVRWALEQPIEVKVKSEVRRSFKNEIARGVSVRYRHLHADSVSFKSARIRHAQIGAIILGPFTILELEDVCLNLPLPAENQADGAKSVSATAPQDGGGSLDRVLDRIGLSDARDVSGLTIRGLRVGRMTDTGAEPLFTAMEAEAMGRSLRLFRCEIFREGGRESVPEAVISTENGLWLVWSGGRLKLPNLVEDGR